MTSHPGPGVLAHLESLLHQAPADSGGALWRLQEEGRQLDANIVRLPANAEVAAHVEPDLDVLVQVLDGSGLLETDGGRQELSAGCTAWLPHGARRAVSAAGDGLVYLTVHRRRPGLSIRSAPLG
ncbi:cupin domain-containing protein [Kitasatospora sp. NPDC101157]|uniref:cupin domain-containing protein n=1 Tax=Kitasatospora sp. NPDC101157 TaxID=3364098 RepID=UPI0037F2221E